MRFWGKSGQHLIGYMLVSLVQFGLVPTVVGQWQWETHPGPDFGRLRVVTVRSVDDFMLSSPSGSLFHYSQEQWDTIQPPLSGLDILNYDYHADPGGSVWLAVTDNDYQTHFFTYANGVWVGFDYVARVPVNGFLSSSEQDMWIYGDWGLLLQYDKYQHRLRPVETPIPTHIFSMVATDDQEFWLGTRAEGIFLFEDELAFKAVPMKGYGADDVNLLVPDAAGSLAVGLTKGGELYSRQPGSDTLARRDDRRLPRGTTYNYHFQSKQYILAISERGKGFFYQGGEWEPLELPMKYQLSDGVILNTTSGVLTTRDGQVLIARPEQQHFFTDIANQSYIDGSRTDHTLGAGWLEINGDELPDLLVLNSGSVQLSRLYVNQGDYRFFDATDRIGLTQPDQPPLVAIGDMTNDGTDDLVGLRLKGQAAELHLIYKSLGDWHHRIQSLPLDGLATPEQLLPCDWDGDGDLDLLLTMKYSFARQPGDILLLKNRFGGWFRTERALPDSLGRGWNYFVLPADFTGDGNTDLYIGNDWHHDKLLVHNGETWRDETGQRLTGAEVTQSRGAAAVDFDNDGDLDLFVRHRRTGIGIYLNHPPGHFSSAPGNFGLDNAIPEDWYPSAMNFGDIDQDGFVDILLSISNRTDMQNLVLFNDHGKWFIPADPGLNITQPGVSRLILGDVDADGDLDIFATRTGPNVLWINNRNDARFLSVRLQGIRSNSSGLGARLWLYPAGAVGDMTRLTGYREIGSETTLSNQINDRRVHFGLPNTNQQYDLAVAFAGGRRVVIQDIRPGTRLTVPEYGSVIRFLGLILPTVVTWFTTPAILAYILTSLLALLLVFLTVWLGWRRYAWSSVILVTVTALNLSAYWIMVLLMRNSQGLLRYAVPVVPVISGTLFPLIWSARLDAVKKIL